MPLDAPVTTQTPAGVMFDYACTGRELDILLPHTSAMTLFTGNPICVTRVRYQALLRLCLALGDVNPRPNGLIGHG